MRCPVCQDTPLNRSSLEEYLAVNACTSCSGHWISSYDYWHWLEWRISPSPHDHAKSAPDASGAAIDAVMNLSDQLPSLDGSLDTDNRRAIFCPDCQHLMRKAKVGHGLEFYLDRCSHCGGVWFDEHEWDFLQATGLDSKVHLIFSEPWQAQIRQDEFKKVLQQTYRSNLGNEDYARAIAIKEWINNHPNKGYLLSLLNQECLTEADTADADAGVPQRLTVTPYEEPSHNPEPVSTKGIHANGHRNGHSNGNGQYAHNGSSNGHQAN